MNTYNLQVLIEAGKLQEAIELANNLRLSFIELKQTIEQKLDDTRRDIRSVDWAGEMDDLLKTTNHQYSEFSARISEARDRINSRLETLEDFREQSEESRQLRDLRRTLDDCYLAHVELLQPIIGARSVFLDEQLRQVLVPPLPTSILDH